MCLLSLLFYLNDNIQVGMGNPHVTIDLGQLMTKELNYKGSFRYGVCNTYSSVLNLS